MSLNNSQYNAIMRIYNQRQFQDKYEQDQRREEVYVGLGGMTMKAKKPSA